MYVKSRADLIYFTHNCALQFWVPVLNTIKKRQHQTKLWQCNDIIWLKFSFTKLISFFYKHSAFYILHSGVKIKIEIPRILGFDIMAWIKNNSIALYIFRIINNEIFYVLKRLHVINSSMKGVCCYFFISSLKTLAFYKKKTLTSTFCHLF